MINTAPGITIQGLTLPTVGQSKLPSVKNTSEAERYPSMPNTQDVLLDSNDEYVAYFRQTDQNGFTQVERMRCIPEPEVTQQLSNSSEYVSNELFTRTIADLKEDIRNVQQSIYDAFAAASRGNGTGRKHHNKSGGQTNSGNVQVARNESQPTANDANFSAAQSFVNAGSTAIGGQ